MYQRYIKRILDFSVALVGLLALSPILLLLCILGAVFLRGNPFFLQARPGRDEKLFSIVKFRTMTTAQGADGKPLADSERLTAYGKFLRKVSLDELPELWNVLVGDMALVGPRPLLTQYLPYYTQEERRRHDVRPGITGLAQINGRNCLRWDERFRKDIEYVENIRFLGDIRILFQTVARVFSASGVQIDSAQEEGNLKEIRSAKRAVGVKE
ncbi:MAG: sugar transferase [Oscillospiraceae bacterium]|jgi:lipopolysaccharide/colanic/teichoic acid biosynthesis glycosyltransferase|nr:sugar transferase [Oscillospiraceae bacterium]